GGRGGRAAGRRGRAPGAGGAGGRHPRRAPRDRGHPHRPARAGGVARVRLRRRPAGGAAGRTGRRGAVAGGGWIPVRGPGAVRRDRGGAVAMGAALLLLAAALCAVPWRSAGTDRLLALGGAPGPRRHGRPPGVSGAPGPVAGAARRLSRLAGTVRPAAAASAGPEALARMLAR